MVNLIYVAVKVNAESQLPSLPSSKSNASALFHFANNFRSSPLPLVKRKVSKNGDGIIYARIYKDKPSIDSIISSYLVFQTTFNCNFFFFFFPLAYS